MMDSSFRSRLVRRAWHWVLALGLGSGLAAAVGGCEERCPTGEYQCACAEVQPGGNPCLYSLECVEGVCVTRTGPPPGTGGSPTGGTTSTTGGIPSTGGTVQSSTGGTVATTGGTESGGSSSGGTPPQAGGGSSGGGGETAGGGGSDGGGVPGGGGAGASSTAGGGAGGMGPPVVANPCDGMGEDDCDEGCSPATWEGAPSSVFMLCDGRAMKSWDAASMHCASHGMRLARLDSLDEYEWLGSLVYPMDHPDWVVGDQGTRVWIGGRDRGDETYGWQDGAAFDFVIWKEGEPSHEYNGNAEDCVLYWNFPPDSFDVLNDSNCADQLPYACERY